MIISLHETYYPPDLCETKIMKLVEQKINAVSDLDKSLPVYLIMVQERYRYNYAKVINYAGFCLKEKGFNNIFVIADDVNRKCVHNYKDRELSIDYFALKTNLLTFKNEQQRINKVWNRHASKALFLTGKAGKKHRVGLLSVFYDKKMMDCLTWSFYVNEGIIQEIKNLNYLSQYSQEQFNKFIRDCSRNPDNISIHMQPQSSHYSGFPYDVSLYENTSISVVSETYADMEKTDLSWTTEKTWRPIVNKHPFILVAEPASREKLLDLGFYFFDDFLLSTENVSNLDDLFVQIADNVQYFLNNKIRFSERINHYVEHNFLKFSQYTDCQAQKLQSFLDNLNETRYKPYDIISEAG
jgi:hypothetical protein